MEGMIFIVLSTFLTPILMFGFGCVFIKNPPKDINGVYGYRTMRSMKNQQTWDFAHQFCGKLWQKIGFVMLVFTIVIDVVLLLLKDTTSIPYDEILLAELFVQVAVLMVSIYPVESALKRNFDVEGNRIEK